jgi:23S rRNA (guanosine2251-2'-O)-methyltransferase
VATAPPAQDRLEALGGVHAVLEVLRHAPERVHKILLGAGRHGRLLPELRRLAKESGVPVVLVPVHELDRQARGRHQGVVALVAPTAYWSLEALLERCGPEAVLVVLAGVEDPHNLGAILRSAECAAADGVILPSRGAAGLTPAVARASAGASALVPVVRAVSLTALATELTQRGFRVIGAEPDGPLDYWQVDWRGRIALVLGSEGRGLSGGLREACRARVRIPCRGRIGSLNLSVSAGVILYELVRQRLAARTKGDREPS